ncbi:hypothetical protein VKT23_012073 [Stygiomarasmius scandens]|uniref:Heterokaryon incompatibility domain-containing protein n=1 Tax=Marasmiellus scandens TaxID=2682957 RepID=A0ABR1JA77_9AGAR
MRLINTSTLRVVQFLGMDIPSYAILSHTWGNEEVVLNEMQAEGRTETTRGKSGYEKIQKSCEIAHQQGFEYVWNDTCCIDKESSAELSEAINSMYRYYGSSGVCLAYLADVSRDELGGNNFSFRNSRWFTRGWTLQELLAPSKVLFYDKDWLEIGTRTGLAVLISAITGIPVSVLQGNQDPKACTVAQRMSWAAHRNTTRVEDLAYCLMGLFGVGMPTLYGEGAIRAFIRLQEEIIKYNDDTTIFAWRADSSSPNHERGLLAWSPSEFIDSGKITVLSDGHCVSTDHVLTNHGLRITLLLRPNLDLDMRAIFVIVSPVLWFLSIRYNNLRYVALALFAFWTVISREGIVPLSLGRIWRGPARWLFRLWKQLVVLTDDPLTLLSKVFNDPADGIVARRLMAIALIAIPPPTSASSIIGLIIWIYSLSNLTYIEVAPKNATSESPSWKFADGFIRARLPCRMLDGRPIEIYLDLKDAMRPQFVRVQPDQLILRGDGRILPFSPWPTGPLFFTRYRRHTIYVKEEFMKGRLVKSGLACCFKISLQHFRIIEGYPNDVNYTVAEGILNTKRVILKLAGASSNNAEFVVAFGGVEGEGYGDSRAWLDIITGDREEGLEEIYRSYDFLNSRSDIRTRALCKSVKTLTDDLSVCVVIRQDPNFSDDTQLQLLVDIQAVPGDITQLYQPGALSQSKYVVAVSIKDVEHLYSWEIPKREHWVEYFGIGDVTGLFIMREEESPSHCLIKFYCRNSGKHLFEVPLDIRRGMPRASIAATDSHTSSRRVISQGIHRGTSALLLRFNEWAVLALDMLNVSTMSFVGLNTLKVSTSVGGYCVTVEFKLYDKPHQFITHQVEVKVQVDKPGNNGSLGKSRAPNTPQNDHGTATTMTRNGNAESCV